MSRLSVPTTARLPSSLRVDPSSPAVSKILGRLSRSSLLSVALDWLDDNNLHLAAPYLRRHHDEESDDDEADDFYPPARSPEALRELYSDLQTRKGSKREILDRILDGDWRHGLTLYQLAMADLQYLYDHPTSQKWSAYRITPLRPPSDPDGEEPPEVDKTSLTIPRFHPSTFLRTLQAQVLPDVKAHYTFDAHKTLPLLLLRIFILDSPYNTNLSLNQSSSSARATATTFDAARTVYLAFPHASPHIFLSKPTSTTISNAPGAGVGGGAGEAKSLRALLVEGIPKALSRPLQRQRFALQSTSLVTRNLAELVERRGGGRTNFAGGGWGIYADEGKGKGGKGRESPLDLVLPRRPLVDEEKKKGKGAGKRGGGEGGEEERARKMARLVAKARFGESGRVGDGKGVERVDVVIEDAFPGDDGEEEGDEEDGGGGGAERSARGRKSDAFAELDGGWDGDDDNAQQQGETWRPRVKLTFHGSHVFAGIRQLVECGIIDGERMPGWMTGEEGVTIGAVRHGRIRGHKGSGL